MTDRELLELAAKAAGVDYWVVRFAPKSAPIEKLHITKNGETVEWNPLIDDGDAMRLAVKLGMQMYIWQPNDGIGLHYTEINRRIKESHNDDPYAATRRAIVRAAAEIGKEMK